MGNEHYMYSFRFLSNDKINRIMILSTIYYIQNKTDQIQK